MPTIRVESLVVGDLMLRPAVLPIVIDALGGAEGILGTEGLEDKRIFIDFRHDLITITRSHSERAGLGFASKSTMTIIPGVGSYVMLGELLVDVEISADAPIANGVT